MTLLVYTLVLLTLGAVYVTERPCTHVEEQYEDAALGSLKDCQKLWGRRFLAFMKAYCPELYKCWMKGSNTVRPVTLSTSDNKLQTTIHVHHIHHLVYLVVVPVLVVVLVLAAFIIWKRRRRGQQQPVLYIVGRNESHW